MVTSTTQKKTTSEENPTQTPQAATAQDQVNNAATQDQANASAQQSAPQSAVTQPSDGVSGTVIGGQQKTEEQAPVVQEAPVAQKQNYITEEYIKNYYQQLQEQTAAQNKYTVEQAVQELQRAREDAQKGYLKQQNQVNIDAAQARDAQALYAAARGDRGGITARQYDSIANTAAKNRTAIQTAQQQLATDTARQIADLRAQGEFEQANNVLQIAQQQLAQLWELQKYEENKEIQEQQLAMSEASLTGKYNGEKTYAAQEAERSWAYDVAMQNIQLGVLPDASILTAAGIDPAQAEMMAYIYAQMNGTQMIIDSYNASKNGTQTGGAAAGGYGGYGGGGSSGSSGASFDPSVDYQALINQAVASGDLSAAAQYEAQRNAKIAAMNAAGTNTGGYTQTNIYTGDGSQSNPGGSPTPSPTYTKQNMTDAQLQAAVDQIKDNLRNQTNANAALNNATAVEQLYGKYNVSKEQEAALNKALSTSDSDLFWESYYKK